MLNLIVHNSKTKHSRASMHTYTCILTLLPALQLCMCVYVCIIQNNLIALSATYLGWLKLFMPDINNCI